MLKRKRQSSASSNLFRSVVSGLGVLNASLRGGAAGHGFVGTAQFLWKRGAREDARRPRLAGVTKTAKTEQTAWNLCHSTKYGWDEKNGWNHRPPAQSHRSRGTSRPLGAGR